MIRLPIDHRSDRPIYQQIADELRARIVAGVYRPGSKLPSETRLVEDYEVTRVTVRRALALLAGEGLTESQRGRGVFVHDAPPVELEEWCKKAARQIGRARVTVPDVVRALLARLLVDGALSRQILVDLRREGEDFYSSGNGS